MKSKILLITEHTPPLVGGTSSYVNSLLLSLPSSYDFHLIYPCRGHKSRAYVKQFSNLTTHSINLYAEDERLDLKRLSRLKYAKEVEKYISQNFNNQEIIVHVLFGWFVWRKISKFSKKNGVGLVVTVHNVPPQESRSSWKGDSFLPYSLDRLRSKLQWLLYAYQLRKFHADRLVVPSQYVKNLLLPLTKTDVTVVEHGLAVSHESLTRTRLDKVVNILTISGITPHKCLEESVMIAKEMRRQGVDFNWFIVGPIRNERYYEHLKNLISKEKLDNVLSLTGAVEQEYLDELKQSASVYVHLSTEEGFCLAALEVASMGVPVVAKDTGALKLIAKMSRGFCLENREIIDPILFGHCILSASGQPHISAEEIHELKKYFNWSRVWRMHNSIYDVFANIT